VLGVARGCRRRRAASGGSSRAAPRSVRPARMASSQPDRSSRTADICRRPCGDKRCRPPASSGARRRRALGTAASAPRRPCRRSRRNGAGAERCCSDRGARKARQKGRADPSVRRAGRGSMWQLRLQIETYVLAKLTPHARAHSNALSFRWRRLAGDVQARRLATQRRGLADDHRPPRPGALVKREGPYA
jgi:hypothetical protein